MFICIYIYIHIYLWIKAEGWGHIAGCNHAIDIGAWLLVFISQLDLKNSSSRQMCQDFACAYVWTIDIQAKQLINSCCVVAIRSWWQQLLLSLQCLEPWTGFEIDFVKNELVATPPQTQLPRRTSADFLARVSNWIKPKSVCPLSIAQ